MDTVPQTLLVDREGNHLLTVETADISGLPEGWTWPEPVLLKAADGKTIIDGVVFKPAHFDPANSYPVIDSSFGKFMPPTGSFSNTVTGGAGYLYNRPASLAQLGFITVVIGQRGAGYGGVREVSYTREKEYWNCISPNQADCVEGIKQLAQTRPYMDLTRVGIGGRASTHAPVGGMLRFPDFYKVGVSCNAYLDHRLAGEFYSDRGYLHEGALEQHPFHALAKNLTGKLLLMHGMMNPVTPVAATFGFVEALKQAGKRFDMLLLPNEGHSDAGYMNHRRWDYFVEHLLGETPPEDFVL